MSNSLLNTDFTEIYTHIHQNTCTKMFTRKMFPIAKTETDLETTKIFINSGMATSVVIKPFKAKL